MDGSIESFDSYDLRDISKSKVLSACDSFRDIANGKIRVSQFSNLVRLTYFLETRAYEISPHEAINLFFDVSQLLFVEDFRARSLAISSLIILRPLVEDAFMVTNSLTKLISKSPALKPSALGLLSQVTDADSLESLIQVILHNLHDRSPTVSSVLAICALRVMQLSSPDALKNLIPQFTKHLDNNNSFSAYHMLAVVVMLKRNDTKSIIALLTGSLVNNNTGASIQAARFINQILSSASNRSNALCESVISTITNYSKKSTFNAVSYEYLKVVIMNSKFFSEQEITTTGEYLASVITNRTSFRVSTLRLAALAARNCPILLDASKEILLSLINNESHTIVGLAIQCLLVINVEDTRLVENLLSSLSSFNESTKLQILQSLRPNANLLPHLLPIIHSEGSLKLKTCALNLITGCKTEKSLDVLADFIEDCEYSTLSCKSMLLVGQNLASSSKPRHFIRILFNRLFLDSPVERLAAVEALLTAMQSDRKLSDIILPLLSQVRDFETDFDVLERIQFAMTNYSAARKPDYLSRDLPPLELIDAGSPIEPPTLEAPEEEESSEETVPEEHVVVEKDIETLIHEAGIEAKLLRNTSFAIPATLGSELEILVEKYPTESGWIYGFRCTNTVDSVGFKNLIINLSDGSSHKVADLLSAYSTVTKFVSIETDTISGSADFDLCTLDIEGKPLPEDLDFGIEHESIALDNLAIDPIDPLLPADKDVGDLEFTHEITTGVPSSVDETISQFCLRLNVNVISRKYEGDTVNAILAGQNKDSKARIAISIHDEELTLKISTSSQEILYAVFNRLQ